MQFEFDDDLIAVRDLAAQIFGDLATADRVAEVETEEGGFDRGLWRILAEAGLLGIAVPETAGGAGMGMLGLVALLEQQARHVAPMPIWSVVAGAALPIAQFGSAQQIQRWLPGLLDGSAPVTGAFDALAGENASVHALRKGDDLVMTGEVGSVPVAADAVAAVLPVTHEDGAISVAVVPTDSAGVSTTSLAVTSRGSYAAVQFADVVVPATDVLPADGTEIVAWTVRRLRVALAALQLGTCEEALRMTASYTSERMQFDRPISTNQAVTVRAADAYLDTEATRLTTYRAAWLMDSGREDDAKSASLVAKWWASRSGLRVVHATQHLHGGIGADVDYPIHRYFLWGRQAAFTLGGAHAVAAELGDTLDEAPPIGAPS